MDDQARSIEVEGEDVEAAVAAGLDQLGVSRDHVDIEVLREESRGMLGIGAREALVRLTVTTPETSLADTGAEAESVPASEPELGLSDTPEDALALARDVLAELLEKMEVEAEIQSRISVPQYPGDSPTLVLDLLGEDLGYLIGRKGETLAAIQHLVRLMVNKAFHRRSHIVVDIGGYKARRENTLRKLALRMADQAARRNRTVALEPMSAYERRIIHVALRDHPTVATESVGERDRRKVTIFPRTPSS
jgi:spoIIIJ-associated protein